MKNKNSVWIALLGFAVSMPLIGCQGTSEGTNGASSEQGASETGHTHGDADKLVWKQNDIEHEGFVISLGHHGVHFHAGDEIEPAIMITKDGQDVADAVVFNSLVSSDGETVLVEEVKTVFEPKTDEEPAHYAQGGLKIPQGTGNFLVRFRIELPGVDGDSTYDVKIDAH